MDNDDPASADMVVNDPTSPHYTTSPTGPVGAAERAVLEKLLTYTVVMRDVAARHEQDDQWTRYADASTVISEVLDTGWEPPGIGDDLGDTGDAPDGAPV